MNDDASFISGEEDRDAHEIDYANSTLTFPQKLFILMEKEIGEIVQWAPHGLCFRINDQEIFANNVVPKYFKHTKLTSFQRQLNLYGFRRLTKGEDQGCYFHPKFQRDRRDLLFEIKRLPIKGTLTSYDQIMYAAGKLPGEKYSSRRRLPSVPPPASNQTATIPPSTGHKIETRSSTQQQAQHGHGVDAIPHVHYPARASAVDLPPPSSSVPLPARQSMSFSFPPPPPPRTMSKLTQNIGFGRNNGGTMMGGSATSRPPSLSLPYPPLPNSYQMPPNYSISSNFASEGRGYHYMQSYVSAPIPEDLDFLDLLKGPLEGLTPPSQQPPPADEYVPTFDEAMLVGEGTDSNNASQLSCT